MKRYLLFLLFACSISYAAQTVKFDYESELIDVFENPKGHLYQDRQKIGNLAANFIRFHVNKYASGKQVYSDEDADYIQRIAFMACDVLNYDGWEEESD